VSTGLGEDQLTMNALNNRELAMGIWSIVFFVWIFRKADAKTFDALKALVKAALAKSIVITFGLLLAYSLALIPLLDSVGLWRADQIKNFSFWFFTFAILYLSKLKSIETDPYYFSNAIKNAVKISAILQFILSIHTFDLWLELIVVPSVTLIIIMAEFAKRDPEHQIVVKAANNILVFVGFLVIGFTIHKLLTNFGEFAKPKTFYDFVVPTLLSILLLPYYYLLAMYSTYERIFIRLRIFIKNEELLKYAKWKAFFSFHFRFFKADRWAYSLSVREVHSKDDIDYSVKRMFEVLDLEGQRSKVRFVDGWQPQRARTYLDEHGLKSSYYKEIDAGYFCASTPYLDLGSEIMPNNIAYYIEGNVEVVKRLCLKLNVNQIQHEEDAKSIFLEIADILCRKALFRKITPEIEIAILTKSDLKRSVCNKDLLIENNKFLTDGYSIGLIIKNPDYSA
jgi:hypothetical protein